MTPDELSAIRARLAAIPSHSREHWTTTCQGLDLSDPVAEFMVYAADDIAALLAEVSRLRKIIEPAIATASN